MYAAGHGHANDLEVIKDIFIESMVKYDGKEGRPLMRPIFMGYTPPWAEPWLQDKLNPHANRAFYVQPSDPYTFFKIMRWIQPDILISPVEPNEFNQSKSHIKAFDAAMSGQGGGQ